MTHAENIIRCMEFRCPEWIPCRVGVHALIPAHREEIADLVREYPRIFPPAQFHQVDFHLLGDRFALGYLRDSWGCLWHNVQPGMIGMVVEHPLADWGRLAHYKPPDPVAVGPFGLRDWDATKRSLDSAREAGMLREGNGETLFDRLYHLRGYENLMLDLASEDPRLDELIEMLTRYELALVDKWLELGVDRIYFHTDIGTQQALMISPQTFRRKIKPMFAAIFGKCRDAGVHVRLSSDGVLLEIIDDLIECGISMHDPQYRANGLGNIVSRYRGRLCVELDLDRQMFPFCTPAEVDEHIRSAIEALYLPEGGLMLSASNSPDVPIEIVRAQCEAFERYCFEPAKAGAK